MSSSKLQLVSSAGSPARCDSVLAGVERVDVLGVSVSVLSRHRLNLVLSACLERGTRGCMSYINVHAVNIANRLPWFRQFLNESLVTYCDGQGVRLGSAILGRSLPERIVMSEWIYDVCEIALLLHAKVFLLGGTQYVIDRTVEVLKQEYTGLQIVGSHHGYIGEHQSDEILKLVETLKPDILVVGMGMPRQEEWVLRNRQRLDSMIILNAGSCFEYVAGTRKRCPVWMGVLGLEWLFRLLHDPRRLWRRYLIGNPLFMLRILRQALSLNSR